jgi:hypothetical protein
VGRRPPIEAYAALPKAVAHNGPLPAAHFRTRRDVVDSSGRVTLRYKSHIHHIGIGRAYAGTRILLLVHDLNVRILTEEGELLRTLVLDPSKDYQGRG